MPYKTNADLPETVRGALPEAAQSIYREVFNSAYDKKADEESAASQAWGAVKNAGYSKANSGKWVKKSSDTVKRLLESPDFGRLLAQVQGPAPGYAPSESSIQCQDCAHASPGDTCARYKFPFTKGWKCDSHKSGQEEKMSKITITKVQDDQRLVFGFFNVNKIGDDLVEDLQGDMIETETLEKAAYNFVLDARIAGEEHLRKNVGRLVESVMFTYEKQAAIQKCLEIQGIEAQIDLGCEGWFGGFRVDDDEVWDAVKKGDYPAFSIGGSGKKESIG